MLDAESPEGLDGRLVAMCAPGEFDITFLTIVASDQDVEMYF